VKGFENVDHGTPKNKKTVVFQAFAAPQPALGLLYNVLIDLHIVIFTFMQLYFFEEKHTVYYIIMQGIKMIPCTSELHPSVNRYTFIRRSENRTGFDSLKVTRRRS